MKQQIMKALSLPFFAAAGYCGVMSVITRDVLWTMYMLVVGGVGAYFLAKGHYGELPYPPRQATQTDATSAHVDIQFAPGTKVEMSGLQPDIMTGKMSFRIDDNTVWTIEAKDGKITVRRSEKSKEEP